MKSRIKKCNYIKILFLHLGPTPKSVNGKEQYSKIPRNTLLRHFVPWNEFSQLNFLLKYFFSEMTLPEVTMYWIT